MYRVTKEKYLFRCKRQMRYQMVRHSRTCELPRLETGSGIVNSVQSLVREERVKDEEGIIWPG